MFGGVNKVKGYPKPSSAHVATDYDSNKTLSPVDQNAKELRTPRSEVWAFVTSYVLHRC